MLEQSFWLLSLISPIILLIGITVGLYRIKFLQNEVLVIWLYLIICFCIDLISRVSVSNHNNLYLIPWLGMLELMLFSMYFKIKNTGNVIFVLNLLGVLYVLSELIFLKWKSVSDFQPYARTVSSSLIVISSMKFTLDIIRRDFRIRRIETNLNTVILIYFFIQLISLLPLNYLVNQPSYLTISIWFFNLIVHLLFYVYLLIYLWKSGNRMKQSSFG
jgi:hypothetical protein